MSRDHILTEAEFLRDVATHQLTVLRDDGVYRHIRLKQPGSSCMYFDLITWPGSLCYHGDMGTYVFSRLTDMFEFFRTDRESPYLKRDGKTLAINPQYWSEKLNAVDGSRHSGSATEFSEVKFRRFVREYLADWWRGHRDGVTADDRRQMREEVEEEILSRLGDDRDGQSAQQATYDFTYRIEGKRPFQFVDFWERDFTDYTRSFMWCCYALAWGIQKYDDARQPVNALEAA